MAPTGPAISANLKVGPLPSRLEILSPKELPINPPTAPAIPRIAKIFTSTFKTSCAKRI